MSHSKEKTYKNHPWKNKALDLLEKDFSNCLKHAQKLKEIRKKKIWRKSEYQQRERYLEVSNINDETERYKNQIGKFKEFNSRLNQKPLSKSFKVVKNDRKEKRKYE